MRSPASEQAAGRVRRIDRDAPGPGRGVRAAPVRAPRRAAARRRPRLPRVAHRHAAVAAAGVGAAARRPARAAQPAPHAAPRRAGAARQLDHHAADRRALHGAARDHGRCRRGPGRAAAAPAGGAGTGPWRGLRFRPREASLDRRGRALDRGEHRRDPPAAAGVGDRGIAAPAAAGDVLGRIGRDGRARHHGQLRDDAVRAVLRAARRCCSGTSPT